MVGLVSIKTFVNKSNTFDDREATRDQIQTA